MFDNKSNINNPFFSIILPTYNRADMLAVAINSVIAQTYSSWELIIIDDASTDNTMQIIASFNDTRIKYYRNEINIERSASRNEGIELACGTYITFLDSDDYYLPLRLENLYNEIILKRSPISFFYTGISFEVDGVVTKREEIVNNFKSDKDFIVIGVIGTPQACLHHSILREHLFNINIHISEDMELWLRIVHDGYKLNFIERYDIIAIEHSGRSVNVVTQNSFQEMAKVLKFMFSKDHPGYDVSSINKRFSWSVVYYGIAKSNICNNKKWKAVFNLFRSALINLKNPQTKHKLFLVYKILITRKNKMPQLNKLMA